MDGLKPCRLSQSKQTGKAKKEAQDTEVNWA